MGHVPVVRMNAFSEILLEMPTIDKRIVSLSVSRSRLNWRFDIKIITKHVE